MSKPRKVMSIIAALVLSLGSVDSYPEDCNAHITPDGAFRSDDGRPRSMEGVECDDWQMNAQIAAALIADFEASGKPILYDYEHNSLYGDSRAAGWIVKLVYAPGRGLFGKVEWTPDAAEEIAKKVYRYSSPLFLFDPNTGAVKKLLSVALTNNPALGDLGAVDLVRRAALAALPLGALANQFMNPAGGLPGNQFGETEMTPEQIAALTSERDTLKTSLVTLTAERDKANTELAALRKQMADDQATADAAKRKETIEAALTAGHLIPAQKEFAESLDTASLTKFMETLKLVAILTQQSDGSRAEGGNGLTKDELAYCSKMGVTPEQFIAARKELAAS